jgi:hypothetical protein
MRKITLACSLFTLTSYALTFPLTATASPSVPEEPSEECLVEQSFDTVVGLLFRSYSTRG